MCVAEAASFEQGSFHPPFANRPAPSTTASPSCALHSHLHAPSRLIRRLLSRCRASSLALRAPSLDPSPLTALATTRFSSAAAWSTCPPLPLVWCHIDVASAMSVGHGKHAVIASQTENASQRVGLGESRASGFRETTMQCGGRCSIARERTTTIVEGQI